MKRSRFSVSLSMSRSDFGGPSGIGGYTTTVVSASVILWRQCQESWTKELAVPCLRSLRVATKSYIGTKHPYSRRVEKWGLKANTHSSKQIVERFG